MSASLKSLSIFVDSRSNVNLKVKYDFSRIYTSYVYVQGYVIFIYKVIFI